MRYEAKKAQDVDLGQDTAVKQNGERPDYDYLQGQTGSGPIRQVTMRELDDEDGSSSSDVDAEDEGHRNKHNYAKREVATHGRINSPRASVKIQTRTERGDDRGRGGTNILRAYKRQLTFGGLYGEDLEEISENYAETANSYDATEF